MTQEQRRITDVSEKDIDTVIMDAKDPDTKVLAMVLKNMNRAITSLVEVLNQQMAEQKDSDRKIAGELHVLNTLFREHEKRYAEDILKNAVDQAKTHSKLYFWNRIGTVAGSIAFGMAGVAFSQYTEIRDHVTTNSALIEAMKKDEDDLQARMVRVETHVLHNEIANLSNDMSNLKKKKVIRASR